MGELLFHPNLNLMEAEVIAREQGGRLVWSRGRVRFIKAQMHADSALAAELNEDHQSALEHIGAAQRQIAGWQV